MTALPRRARRHVELHAFRGYGTPARLLVRGRVLRSTGLTRSRLGDSVLDNLRNMFRRFESDEVPGALVAARAAVGDEVRARPTRRATSSSPSTCPVRWPTRGSGSRSSWSCWRRPRPDGPARATSQVLVPRDPQYAVISDLDDTVLRSNATSLWQMARLTLLHNAHTRLPFEGVAGFYQALQRGRDGEAYNPVFYVSNSPWNLYDLLEDFLDLQGMPRGPLLLRDWSLRTLKAGEGHKLAAIQALLDAYPGLPVVLVGDSGERDPEIYRQVVLRHPGRVLAVYVRDVAPERHDAVRAIAAELAGHGVELVFSPDTEAARRHALDRGLIVAAALPERSLTAGAPLEDQRSAPFPPEGGDHPGLLGHRQRQPLLQPGVAQDTDRP
jgi:phosphatidate phosphatase APP1